MDKPSFQMQVLPQDQVHSLGEISSVENNSSNNGSSLNTISEIDEEMQIQGRLNVGCSFQHQKTTSKI